MARSKQQQEKKDGQHRKETKEERRARLQAEQEAKEVRMSIIFDGQCVTPADLVPPNFLRDLRLSSALKITNSHMCAFLIS